MTLGLYVQQIHAGLVVRELLLLYIAEVDGADLVALLSKTQGTLRILNGQSQNPLACLQRRLAGERALHVVKRFERGPCVGGHRLLLLGRGDFDPSLQRAAGEDRSQYITA